MPRKSAIKKIPKIGVSEDVLVYVLYTPDFGEPDFYRQATSLSAFFHSLKSRNETEHFYYVWEPWVEFERQQSRWAKYGADFIYRVDEREFRSIWDFYKFIGYDYKTKKWVA